MHEAEESAEEDVGGVEEIKQTEQEELKLKKQAEKEKKDKEAAEEQKMQMATSLRAKVYLEKFFAELAVPFTTGSRTEIEASFMKAKELRPDSDLFS